MQTIIRLFGALLLVAVASLTAHGTPIYKFGFEADGGFDFMPGEQKAVRVYLYELYTPESQTVLGPGDEGLGNLAVRLSYVNAPVDPTANTATLTSFAGNTTDFYDFQSYLSGDLAQEYGHLDPIAGVANFVHPLAVAGALGEVADSDDGPAYRILVGTFMFTAGDEIGEETTLLASVLDQNSDNIILFDWPIRSLDGNEELRDGTLQVITVVPEPPTLVAFSGLAVAGLFLWFVHFLRGSKRT